MDDNLFTNHTVYTDELHELNISRETFTNTGGEYTDIPQSLFKIFDKAYHLLP